MPKEKECQNQTGSVF